MFQFKSYLLSICISFFCVGFICSSASAAMLIVDDNRLMGAENVLVDGVHYDVYFLDGTLAEFYEGADECTDLPFTVAGDSDASGQRGTEAAQALLDQVLIGIYDIETTLTNGVGATRDTTQVNIITPYWVENDGDINTVVTINAPDGIYSYDRLYYTNYAADFDTAWWAKELVNGERYDATVIAVWSLSEISSVPVPSTIFIFGSGIVCLVSLRRKKLT